MLSIQAVCGLPLVSCLAHTAALQDDILVAKKRTMKDQKLLDEYFLTIDALPTNLLSIVVVVVVVVVSVEAKLIFVEPGRRRAHSPSSSKAPGISYRGTMKTSVTMLRTSGSL